jgi:hypothetical protein
MDAGLKRRGEVPDVGSSPLSFRELFGLDEALPFTCIPDALDDAMTALGLSDGARQTLRCYYRYARMSAHHAQVTPAGEIRVWPSEKTLSRLRGLTGRQIQRHRRELAELGIIRTEVTRRGQTDNTYLKPMSRLYEELRVRGGIQERMSELHPDAYHSKVVPIEFAIRDKNVALRSDKNVGLMKKKMEEEETALAGVPTCTDEDFENWLEEMQERTKALLAAADGAKQKNSEAAEHQRNKPRSLKMGGGAKKAPATEERRTSAPEMLKEMRGRMSLTMPGYQPPVGMKELGQMRTLLEQHGEDAVRTAMQWITTPENWKKLRQVCNINSQVPTVGVLLGFQATIFPLALDPSKSLTGPKRSGGARLETEEAPKEVLGSF